jgi:hypothetical protein
VRAETHVNVSHFCRILTQIGTCQHILDKVPKYEILQKSWLSSMWLISCRVTFFKSFVANTLMSLVEVCWITSISVTEFYIAKGDRSVLQHANNKTYYALFVKITRLTMYVTLRRVHVTIINLAISIIFWVCVCNVSYPARKTHTPITRTLRSVVCPAVPYFSILSHTTIRFLEKVTAYKICVLIFCTTFVWKLLILRLIARDMIKYAYLSSCKVPVTLVHL